MSTQNMINNAVTDRRSVKLSGRRVAGSYGRVQHGREKVANRTTRHHAKQVLNQ